MALPLFLVSCTAGTCFFFLPVFSKCLIFLFGLPFAQVPIYRSDKDRRYTCGISSEEELTVDALVNCWKEVSAGNGNRIFASRKL